MRAWWCCFAVVLLLYLACMASNFLTCRPLSKYWSASKSSQTFTETFPLTPPAGCSDPEDIPEDIVRADASIKFAISADVIADVIIMLLPLKLL